jgi:murein DD-endopeptidase MepM/ murein hydrolase activator NlpD
MTAPKAPAAYILVEQSGWYYQWPTPKPAYPHWKYRGVPYVPDNQEPGYGACRPSSRSPRGCGRPHRGIDIYARYGTPVIAPESGEVTSYGGSDVFVTPGSEASNGGAGRFVRFLGDSGWRYTFMHLMGVSAEVARLAGIAKDFGNMEERPLKVRLKAGEIIGYVGTTGGIVNPHLHFEIQVQGKTVDLNDLLRAMRR